ncbi:MAG: lamin tail domain-containing protein [Bacteroidia bacterium]
MKKITMTLIVGLLLATHFLSAQFSDDFSDGEFLQNPVWSGEQTHFLVTSNGELQSAGTPATDTIHLSIPNLGIHNMEWRFYLRYEFAPSTANVIRIYLVSDQENIESSLSGYFVGVGESGNEDSFDLFRQDGASVTKLIDGIPGRAATKVHAVVRVLRDSLGNWSLFSDDAGDGNFTLEGAAFDQTYVSSAWFGIWVKHSATRNTSFFFDNFYVGNVQSDTIPVVPPVYYHFQDIIINEIFADPTPSVGLPESEFLELYNRSRDTVNLSGFSITNGTTVGVLPEKLVMPGGYLILASSATAAQFDTYGETLSPSAWPALVNGGDNLGLRSATGELIDSVDYELRWYGDEEKQNGGFSLEKINPEAGRCPEATNWMASKHILGGTPGFENSVYHQPADTLAPQLVKVEWVDSLWIRLCFSGPLDPVEAESVNHYRFDPEGQRPLSAWVSAPENLCVELLLEAPLTRGTMYRIVVTEMRDCRGKEFSVEGELGLPEEVMPGDVLINELLFNPYAGGSDFVEIVNVSGKMLDYSQLFIGEIFPGTDSIYNGKIISAESRLFMPGEIVCLTANVDFQKSTYLPPAGANFWEMKSFPGYDDHAGECVIFTSDQLVIDRVAYLDDYHFASLRDKEGVSLERISLRRPGNDPANWHSAAETVLFATPGYANSQAIELSDEKSNVSLAYQTFSPNGDGEKDVLPVNYDFDFSGANARVTVFDTAGRKVREIQSNILLGAQPGTIFWDGTNDRNQKMETGMYIILFEVTHSSTGDKYIYREVAVLTDKF